VDENVVFPSDEGKRQRAVTVSSLAVGDAHTAGSAVLLTLDGFSLQTVRADAARSIGGNILGLYDDVSHELATIAWPSGDVKKAEVARREHSLVARLTLSLKQSVRTTYGYYTVENEIAARALLKKLASKVE
jgi:hypothetical protein